MRVSNSLDPDQAPHFVGPGLGPNCLQKSSADNTSKQRAVSCRVNNITLSCYDLMGEC